MTIKRPPAIVINDSTLRDVQRYARPELSRSDRTIIARGLEKLGVAEIEFAFPSCRATAIADLAITAAALDRAKPVLWGPASRRTVDAAIRSGFAAVTLSVKLSSRFVGRTAVLHRITGIIGHARESGLTVAICGEDASRADFDLIRAVIATAESAGASRFRYTETDLELEFRGHDDFGLATANTLAAVQGGATHVSVSMVRRAAHSNTAQLEDVVGAIRISTLHPVDVDLALMPPLASRVATLLGLPSATTGRRWIPPHDAMTRGIGVSHVMGGR
jgi:homocitrate synthase NifV